MYYYKLELKYDIIYIKVLQSFVLNIKREFRIIDILAR